MPFDFLAGVIFVVFVSSRLDVSAAARAFAGFRFDLGRTLLARAASWNTTSTRRFSARSVAPSVITQDGFRQHAALEPDLGGRHPPCAPALKCNAPIGLNAKIPEHARNVSHRQTEQLLKRGRRRLTFIAQRPQAALACRQIDKPSIRGLSAPVLRRRLLAAMRSKNASGAQSFANGRTEAKTACPAGSKKFLVAVAQHWLADDTEIGDVFSQNDLHHRLVLIREGCAAERRPGRASSSSSRPAAIVDVHGRSRAPPAPCSASALARLAARSPLNLLDLGATRLDVGHFAVNRHSTESRLCMYRSVRSGSS